MFPHVQREVRLGHRRTPKIRPKATRGDEAGLRATLFFNARLYRRLLLQRGACHALAHETSSQWLSGSDRQFRVSRNLAHEVLQGAGFAPQEVNCVHRIGASLNRLSPERGLVRGLQTRTIPYCTAKALFADGFLHNVLVDRDSAWFAQSASMDRDGFLSSRHPGVEPGGISLSSLRPPRPLSSRQRPDSPLSSRATRPSSLGTP